MWCFVLRLLSWKRNAGKYGVSCYMVTHATAHNLNPGLCVMTLIRYKHLHKEQKWPVLTKQWHTLAAPTLLFSCTNLRLRINSNFLLISIFDYEKKSSWLHLEPQEPPSEKWLIIWSQLNDKHSSAAYGNMSCLALFFRSIMKSSELAWKITSAPSWGFWHSPMHGDCCFT